MSLDLGYQSLDVKLTGKSVYVPDNHLARLMYYLSCVAVVLEVDKNNKLLEYQNYYLLTEKEEELVVVFALLFNPKILKEKYLFLVGDKFVPAGTDNEFFELTNNNFGIHISSEVIIGGVSRKVLNLMGCNESWLERNYYNPLTHYINSRPDLFEKEKKNNCESTCNCFVSCFDSCCSCCDCGCGNCGKKICCFVFWGAFIAFAVVSIITSLMKN